MAADPALDLLDSRLEFFLPTSEEAVAQEEILTMVEAVVVAQEECLAVVRKLRAG